ncbi:MAG: isochorismatase family protein [Proteobacteria bacterium]|nr:MAG: isochorismatase family protein [Pseudomonadota bacterium]
MPNHRNSNLHGNVPDRGKTALLIIDVLSNFTFPGASSLLAQATAKSQNIAALKSAFRRWKLPVVYANDNYGKWRSSREIVLAECLKPGSRGCRIAETL